MAAGRLSLVALVACITDLVLATGSALAGWTNLAITLAIVAAILFAIAFVLIGAMVAFAPPSWRHSSTTKSSAPGE